MTFLGIDLEWESDCWLTSSEQFFWYILARTCYIRWNDNVNFVLDQHAELDFDSAISLNQ